MGTDPTTRAEPLLALVLDDDLIAAEFNAIIAAEWPDPVRQQSVPPTRHAQLSNRSEGLATKRIGASRSEPGRLCRAVLPARQRSPPVPADT